MPRRLPNAIAPTAQEMDQIRGWVAALVPGRSSPLAQGRTSRAGQPRSCPAQLPQTAPRWKIGAVEYARGLYCHASSKILVRLPAAAKVLTAVAGVDAAAAPNGSVVFSVSVGGREAFRSPLMRGENQGVTVRVDLDGAD